MSNRYSTARRAPLQNVICAALVVMATALLCVLSGTAHAQTLTTLYYFRDNGDGAGPFAGLTPDGKGNFFGTTQQSGAFGGGTAYELSPDGSGNWNLSTIWNFGGPSDGSAPSFSMVRDKNGRLFGETQSGGAGSGTVFVLTPPASAGESWTESVIYDGSAFHLYGGIALDSVGAIYGTQILGGTNNQGLVFKLTPLAGGGYSAATIYNFGGTFSGDAEEPYGLLSIDRSGNLYGTTHIGGSSNIGAVYKLTPPHGGTGAYTETVIYSFTGGATGCHPDGNLLLDRSGQIYGTTTECGGTANAGMVFRLSSPKSGSSPWTETVIKRFGSATGGGQYASLTVNPKTTTLYGTSFYSGGYGLVFQLTPPASGKGIWNETILHTFSGGFHGFDGGYPVGPLVWDASGTLYGVTNWETGLSGTIFSLTP